MCALGLERGSVASESVVMCSCSFTCTVVLKFGLEVKRREKLLRNCLLTCEERRTRSCVRILAVVEGKSGIVNLLSVERENNKDTVIKSSRVTIC